MIMPNLIASEKYCQMIRTKILNRAAGKILPWWVGSAPGIESITIWEYGEDFCMYIDLI